MSSPPPSHVLSSIQREHAIVMRVLCHRISETRALAARWRRGEHEAALAAVSQRATLAVAADVLGALAGGGLAAAGLDALPTVAPVSAALLASVCEELVLAGVRALAAAEGMMDGARDAAAAAAAAAALVPLALPLRAAISRLPPASELAAPAAACLAALDKLPGGSACG